MCKYLYAAACTSGRKDSAGNGENTRDPSEEVYRRPGISESVLPSAETHWTLGSGLPFAEQFNRRWDSLMNSCIGGGSSTKDGPSSSYMQWNPAIQVNKSELTSVLQKHSKNIEISIACVFCIYFSQLKKLLYS